MSVSLCPTAMCTAVDKLLMTRSVLNNKNMDMLCLTKEKMDSSGTVMVTCPWKLEPYNNYFLWTTKQEAGIVVSIKNQ